MIRTKIFIIYVFSIMLMTDAITLASEEIELTNSNYVRPMHTYSIVARDPKTGEMGVVVQSHWFSVGPIVPWAEAGVGVVATQSLVDVSYGPLGLELMKNGKSAEQALKALLAADENREVRQVAMLDKDGNVAVHTGTKCIPEAGHIKGENFSVQANLMLSDKVWPAMAQAYKKTKGDLIDKMLAALEAAQKEGGDIRGKQSAAIIVVKGKSSGKVWEDKIIDLRVEDHSEPIQELKRLVKIHRAYEHMNKGDLAIEKNDFATAMKEYKTAEQLFPENLEMKFWHAVSLVNKKKVTEALPLFADIFQQDKNWLELVKRLPKVGLLPDNEQVINKIVALGEAKTLKK